MAEARLAACTRPANAATQIKRGPIMVAKCLGHQCMESRYRAIVQSFTVKNKKGEGCGTDAEIVKAITDGWADDAAEDDHCDSVCICNMPPWPATWTLLESNVTYTAAYVTLDCKADVTITYNWEYQERSAPCRRKAPTKSGK